MSKCINKYSEDIIGKMIILDFMCSSYLILQAIPKSCAWQSMLIEPRRAWDMGIWACLLGWSWLLIDVGRPTHFSRPTSCLRSWTGSMENGRRGLHASTACCFLTADVMGLNLLTCDFPQGWTVTLNYDLKQTLSPCVAFVHAVFITSTRQETKTAWVIIINIWRTPRRNRAS